MEMVQCTKNFIYYLIHNNYSSAKKFIWTDVLFSCQLWDSLALCTKYYLSPLGNIPFGLTMTAYLHVDYGMIF